MILNQLKKVDFALLIAVEIKLILLMLGIKMKDNVYNFINLNILL